MADFMKLMLACETAFWEEGTFERVYRTNLEEVTARVLAADQVAMAVRDLMLAREVWEGSPTDLLLDLEAVVAERAARARSWPNSAHTLSTRLRRASPKPPQGRHRSRAQSARRNESGAAAHQDYGAGRSQPCQMSITLTLLTLLTLTQVAPRRSRKRKSRSLHRRKFAHAAPGIAIRETQTRAREGLRCDAARPKQTIPFWQPIRGTGNQRQ